MFYNNEFKYILIPIITLFLTQLIKFTIESIKHRKILIKRFLNGSGGMPSTHSSTVTSLLTTIGIFEGIKSPLFSICFVLTLIVCYDASGVRLESGKQALVLNQLTSELHLNKSIETKFSKLKEKIGHTNLEVLVGIIFGIILPFLLIK